MPLSDLKNARQLVPRAHGFLSSTYVDNSTEVSPPKKRHSTTRHPSSIRALVLVHRKIRGVVQLQQSFGVVWHGGYSPEQPHKFIVCAKRPCTHARGFAMIAEWKISLGSRHSCQPTVLASKLHITPSMEIFSGNGVVWGSMGQQLGCTMIAGWDISLHCGLDTDGHDRLCPRLFKKRLACSSYTKRANRLDD